MMALTFMLNLQTHEGIGICKKLFNFLANPKDIYHFKIIFSFEGWRNEKQLALSLFVKQKSHKLIMSIPITTS